MQAKLEKRPRRRGLSPRSVGTPAGGQGAVTAAKMVAELALGQGKYFQAFPEYGPERSGAPIVAFTRVSDEPIQLYCGVEHPGIVVVLDSRCSASSMSPRAPPTTRSSSSTARCRRPSCASMPRSQGGRLFTVAATRIATETIRRPIPNTPMVGALTRITGSLPHRRGGGVPALRFRQEVPSQGGRGQHHGPHPRYEEVSRASERRKKPQDGTSATLTPGAPTSMSWGPPSPRPATPTTSRPAAGGRMVPGIDSEKCNGCMLCYFYCPDASIISRERQSRGRRSQALQGLRHLRQRVPGRRHHHEDRREGVTR